MSPIIKFLSSVVIIWFVFIACSPMKSVNKNDIMALNVGDEFIAENKLIESDSKFQINLLGIFNNSKPNVDLCTLKIESPTQLVLKYVDSTSIYAQKSLSQSFEGRLLSNGVFEIYHEKKRIEIPPFFPIIYSNVNVRRVRIGLLKNNELAVEYKVVNSGNWFLLAAGYSLKDTYCFKLKDLPK